MSYYLINSVSYVDIQRKTSISGKSHRKSVTNQGIGPSGDTLESNLEDGQTLNIQTESEGFGNKSGDKNNILYSSVHNDNMGDHPGKLFIIV